MSEMDKTEVEVMKKKIKKLKIENEDLISNKDRNQKKYQIEIKELNLQNKDL